MTRVSPRARSTLRPYDPTSTTKVSNTTGDHIVGSIPWAKVHKRDVLPVKIEQDSRHRDYELNTDEKRIYRLHRRQRCDDKFAPDRDHRTSRTEEDDVQG